MENREKMLLEEKIGKLLFKLSLPATIGMVVNALYNVIDTIFIGWGAGTMAIGGLTIAFPIQMILMSIAQMIGIGTSSAISRNLGMGDKEKADYFAGNSYVLIFIISVVFAILGTIFVEPLLRIFGASDNLLVYAKDYITIILYGSVFFSFAVSSNNLIRAEGNAKVAMFAMLVGTGLNIVLDPIFIFVFNMGIKGAALATIISQFASFLFVVRYMYSGKSMLKIEMHHLKLKKEYVMEIISVGFPSFIRQVGGSVLSIVLNNSLVFYGGDIAVATFGIINRVIMFLFMPMFGVVQGLQPIAGFNYGAKRMDRVIEVIKISIKILVVFASISTLIVMIFPKILFMIFTNDAEVARLGMEAIRIVILMLPVVGIQIVSASAFQAFGKPKPAMILSMSRQIGILIPLILILPRISNLGLAGIYISFPISDFISTIISGVMLKLEINKLKKSII